MPAARNGWVRIKVGAFGLNRSELHTRLGLAEGVVFPRVPGIECAGVVDAAPGTDLQPGQRVVPMMGGMGRVFDGGYAEYTSVPRSCVIPVVSDLPWEVLGALPEMLQTSYGSLTVGLAAKAGQTLLIRGGTSSIGMATAALAKEIGMTVISTTRRPDRTEFMLEHGIDHVVVDNGTVADVVRALVPAGVDAALELVGTPTLPDTLRATKMHGVVCFTGMLSNEWLVKDFYPIGYIPSGVRLTGYGGESSDLPAEVFQRYVDLIAAGRLTIALHKVYRFDEIQQAHRDMEDGVATGKLVVLTH
jgi:NADPH:quinone reductase-like Zn-dependent oxidoreductase